MRRQRLMVFRFTWKGEARAQQHVNCPQTSLCARATAGPGPVPEISQQGDVALGGLMGVAGALARVLGSEAHRSRPHCGWTAP